MFQSKRIDEFGAGRVAPRKVLLEQTMVSTTASKKAALVTGASSSMGKAFAKGKIRFAPATLEYEH
jgi:FlaA1/EpsC-like NDP-sugar epimerase